MDRFDRKRLLIAALAFGVFLVAGFYAASFELSPIQAMALRIAVSMCAAGLPAALIASFNERPIDGTLYKALALTVTVAAGLASYAFFPLLHRESPVVQNKPATEDQHRDLLPSVPA